MSDTPPDPPKRGRGRPRTRPAELVTLRCEVTPEEAELVRQACESKDVTQGAFTRAAVVRAAQQALKKPPGRK